MNRKRIVFALVIVIVVAGIWYLESVKVHPEMSGGASQSLGLDPQNIPTNVATGAIAKSLAAIANADIQAGYKPASELVDPTGFVNTSSSFTIGSLIGKDVILVDFWTYSCINCIRTLPYVTGWYQKYKNDGFVIVGVHTPEFDFEKDINNVQAATQKYGIQYPVVLDSNYGTWQAYGNLYWPHEYLIDLAGYIVHDQIGEGNYDETETEIQKLLSERANTLGVQESISTSTLGNIPSSNISNLQSPETYFGAERNQTLANGNQGVEGAQMLALPNNIALNDLYLVGSWNFMPQYATNNATGTKIIFEYDAQKVYFVASAPSGATVQVLQDGKPIGNAAGSDVSNGILTVGPSRLYSIVNNPDGAGEHTLELIVNSPGLQAFTFTFG